jgi:LysM repeat protein
MKKQAVLIIALLAILVVPSGNAMAWYGCGGYVTVQWGDTLSGLAAYCGTSVEAIRAANPGLGWWLYAGQVIYVPSGYTAPVYYPQTPSANTYVVQAGDTMGIIAARYGVTVYDLIAANPQIWNPSLIYVGQVIYLPTCNCPQPNPPPVIHPQPYQPVNPPSSSTLKITYKKGLVVRDTPGGTIIGWATYDRYKEWYYHSSTFTKDTDGKIWVQVTLDPPQHGYSIGWILVEDQYGNNFTSLDLDW